MSRSFLGVVTRRDLLGRFDREVLQRNRLLARVRTFRRGRGTRWTSWSCPRNTASSRSSPVRLEGLTVGEAGLRARYGVSVLAVKRLAPRGPGAPFRAGAPRTVSSTGTSLVVLGSDEALARLHDDRALPVPTPS